MKRDTTGFIKLLVILLILGLLQGCKYVGPDAGQEAVLTDKPYLPGHGGVEDKPVTAGRSIEWMSTQVTYVSMVPQARKVSFDDFSSKDHVLLDLDTTVILQVTDSVSLIKHFGPDWFEHNVQGPYGQMVRDVVKEQSVPDMMSSPATALLMDQEVAKGLTQLFKDQSIPVKVIQVTLGRAKPNQKVLEQMNATAAQEQRKLTEAAYASAEEARKDAEQKRAEADNAYRSSLGYTTEQYATMQIAQIQADACKAAQQCIIAPPGTAVIATHK